MSKAQRQALREAKWNSHPVRMMILGLFENSDDEYSPKGIAYVLKLPLTNVGYHVQVLREYGAITLTKETLVRGAKQHWYKKRVAA